MHSGWTGGIVDGVLFRGSMYNNAPFKKTIAKFVGDHTIQRQLFVSACDANTGEYIVFDGSHAESSDLPEMCTASSAIPGVYPASEQNGRVLIDGGTIWSVNVFSAVEGCRALGYKDKNIIVDILMTSHAEVDSSIDITKLGTLEMYFRYVGRSSLTT